MKIKVLILIGVAMTMLFCGGNQQKQTYSEKYDLTKDTSNSKIINFDLNDFTEITNYKEINFQSEKYLYDVFLQKIDSSNFNLKYCVECYNKRVYNNDERTFVLNTSYGKVKFTSISDGDLFLEYHYLKNFSIPDYKIIVAYGIDLPYTIFLDNQNYGGFRTNGEVYFSNDKKYFISVSNPPDYCLLEIYKIDNGKITNIVNLYSIDYPIDIICWEKEVFCKTILMNNICYYFKIDFASILNKFE